MKKAKTDLPILPSGFPDQSVFCSFARPYLATQISDFDEFTPASIRKCIFASQRWRLSTAGWQMLREAFATYDVVHDDNIVVTGKILIGMDFICNGPWALRGKTVTLFDPILFFELQMVGGDLRTFIDFKKVDKV